ncbi:hypothetical protein LCGC14_2962470, partial [marine sediment metagenome]
IDRWKRGVLPPMPAFPAVAIMPERVDFEYSHSGGKYTARWAINVEFFAKQRTPEEAMEQVRYYSEVTKSIFEEFFQWEGLAIDSEIVPREYEELIPFQGQYLQMGAVPIEIVTYEEQPANREVLTEFRWTDSTDLIQVIYDRLTRQKNESQMTLKQVKQFYRAHIPPVPDYPAVTLTEPIIDHERTYTALDSNSRLFEISVLTHLLDQEQNLDLNLDLTEVLIDILQAYYAWGGRCINSPVLGVQFFRESNELGKVYRSTISYQCQSLEEIGMPSANQAFRRRA